MRYLFFLLSVFIASQTFADTSQPLKSDQSAPRIIRFKWRPPNARPLPYSLIEPEDQHQIVLFPGVEKGGKYPVAVGFHGTYKSDKPPREYRFLRVVRKVVEEMISAKEIPPLVLVLPAFRFKGQNWPDFDVRAFRKEIERRLEKEGVGADFFLMFGHSGAAGCGGDGLNRAHRMSPRAVGFFDTCLGRGWQREIRELKRQKIATVNVHSVETAGFRPRQRPEYQPDFDFGRAYGPLGIEPIECSKKHPGDKLRNQKYRCAATSDGVIRSFIVDTGEGPKAHSAAVPVGLRYFLKEFARK
ncbi:MAG: hypothetical protein GY847_20530 [Proteobacteria bacterium]|nr:hypothetical protein [Pseudomonadota bacterium]